MRTIFLLLMLALGALWPSGADGAVRIDVNADIARRMLEISCSRRPVDRSEFDRSAELSNALAHQRRFGAVYTLENYIRGVEAIARCEVPSPDPFRFAALVQRREEMTRTINYLYERRAEIGRQAAAMIAPYLPRNMDFTGAVILAPATFSCGGFARGGFFFIDLPCIATNVEGEYQAVISLIAHETYHSAQERFMPAVETEYAGITNPRQAYGYVFRNLAGEGSASHVADMRRIEGNGPYATFSRREAQRNYGHLAYNFRLLNYAIELLGQPHQDYVTRFQELYGLAFEGAFGQISYFVGQQMSAEIANDFGPAGLACTLALPPENFVLAYDRAYATGQRLEHSSPPGPAMLAAARQVAAERDRSAELNGCLARRS